MDLMKRSEICEEFFWYVRSNFRTNQKAADLFDCSSSFISAVSNGKKEPNEKMLEKMGYEKVEGFQQIVDLD